MVGVKHLQRAERRFDNGPMDRVRIMVIDRENGAVLRAVYLNVFAPTSLPAMILVNTFEAAGVELRSIEDGGLVFDVFVFGINDPEYVAALWACKKSKPNFMTSRINSRTHQPVVDDSIFAWLDEDFVVHGIPPIPGSRAHRDRHAAITSGIAARGVRAFCSFAGVMHADTARVFDTRLGYLEQVVEEHDKRLDDHDGHFDAVDNRLDEYDEQFAQLTARLNSVESKAAAAQKTANAAADDAARKILPMPTQLLLLAPPKPPPRPLVPLKSRRRRQQSLPLRSRV